jgi:hypothetical protein
MSKHRNKPPKFRDTWANQTTIGKRFGLSAVAVGNLLKAAGLKDPVTGDATPRALAEGFAVATPLQDGEAFFLWHAEKVGALIGARHEPLSKVESWVREIEADLKRIDAAWDAGDDKAASIMLDLLYDGVPQDIKAEVEAEINRLHPDTAAGPPATHPPATHPPATHPPAAHDRTRAPWED